MVVNSPKAWFLAARPKTLAGAAAPVLIGGALAVHNLRRVMEADATVAKPAIHGGYVWVFVLCLLFAFIMQIDANLVNDYFDFKKGTDREDRLGPERACAQGWVTPEAMKRALWITTIVGCAVGLPLVWIGGPWMILVRRRVLRHRACAFHVLVHDGSSLWHGLFPVARRLGKERNARWMGRGNPLGLSNGTRNRLPPDGEQLPRCGAGQDKRKANSGGAFR